MKSYTIAKGIIKALSFFIGIALLLFILYKVRILIIYVIVAIIIALLGRPLVIFFKQKLHIKKTVGAIITLILILGLMVGLVGMFIPMLKEQGKNFALYNFDGIETELDTIYNEVSEYFGTSKEAVENLVKESNVTEKAGKEIGDDAAPTLLDTVLGILTQLSVGLFSVFFMAFFMLKENNSLRLFVLAMIPPAHRDRTTHSLEKIETLLSRYFLGLLVQILVLFVIYACTLFYVGTEQALIIAFFCALFNIVPYAGPLIGAVLMVVLTMTSHIEMDFSREILPLIGYVMIGVIIGQLVDNLVSQPFIYSNSVKSHPLEIFVIIIGAGLLFGIVGMLVAVPGYAVLKVIFKEFFSESSFVRVWTKGM